MFSTRLGAEFNLILKGYVVAGIALQRAFSILNLSISIWR
jgi:hypothetical protein